MQSPREEDTAIVCGGADYEGLATEVRRTSQYRKYRQCRTPGIEMRTAYARGRRREDVGRRSFIAMVAQ